MLCQKQGTINKGYYQQTVKTKLTFDWELDTQEERNPYSTITMKRFFFLN